MNNEYKLKINCVVLSTDIPNNKQFVLSLSKNEIDFPAFECSAEFLQDKEKYLVRYLKKYIFVPEVELMPQIIGIDTQYISSSKNTINIIYGFITSKTSSISNDVCWFEFDYHKPNLYSNILFEVTQKLK